jgi:hypothetical protein
VIGLIGQAGGTSADFHLPNVSWYALTPFLVLVAGSLVVLVLGALLRTEPVRRAFAPLTALIAIAAGITAIPLWHKVSDHGAYTTIAGSVGIDWQRCSPTATCGERASKVLRSMC